MSDDVAPGEVQEFERAERAALAERLREVEAERDTLKRVLAGWLVEMGALRLEAKIALAKVAEYENCIAWDTTCKRDAQLLDACYQEAVRAEKAERVLARARTLADLRERQARWKSAAGERIWRSSGFTEQRGLNLCRTAGEYSRRAADLRVIFGAGPFDERKR